MAQDNAESANEGNRQARICSEAFKELVSEYGDEGREALKSLFEHPYPRVRCVSAAFLLRYDTCESLRVLRELEKGSGLVAFGASQSIKNWENGDWELDPEGGFR
ncbi:MAG: DUF2019 domain-containing protein [Planctomycetales bacterium]|nr:DUF2019 domain-containing protein [Planctomycetales bacterium]